MALSGWGNKYKIDVTNYGNMGSADPYQVVDLHVDKAGTTQATGILQCNGDIDDSFDSIRFVAGSDDTTILNFYPHDFSSGTSCEFDIDVPAGEEFIYAYFDDAHSPNAFPLKHGMCLYANGHPLMPTSTIRYSGTYDRTYLTYMSMDFSPWLTAYDHDDGVWLKPLSIGPSLHSDLHDNPAIAIVKGGTYAGHAHIMYGYHSVGTGAENQGRHYRGDVDVAWGTQSFTNITANFPTFYLTYPKLWADDDDRVWLFARGRATLADCNTYASYAYMDASNGDEHGDAGTWSAVNTFITTGEYCYFDAIVVEDGADPKIHVSWGHYSAGDGYHNVYYAYRGSDSTTWYDIAGTSLGTLIAIDEAATKIYTGAAYSRTMALDSNGYPWLMWRQNWDGSNFEDAMFAAWNGSSWDSDLVVDGVYPQIGGLRWTSDTQVEVYLSEKIDGVLEISHYTGTVSGGTWTFSLTTQITSGSEGLGHYWPIVVRNATIADVAVVWNYNPNGSPSTIQAYPKDLLVQSSPSNSLIDTIWPAHVFHDDFNRDSTADAYRALSVEEHATIPYGIWNASEHATQTDGLVPHITGSSELRMQVNAYSAKGQILAYTQVPFSLTEGVRFRAKISKTSMAGANNRIWGGVFDYSRGWSGSTSVLPNTCISYLFLTPTSVSFIIIEENVFRVNTNVTVGSGDNLIEILYDFTTGYYKFIVDGVVEASGQDTTYKADIAGVDRVFFNAYNAAGYSEQIVDYDYVTLSDYATDGSGANTPVWGTPSIIRYAATVSMDAFLKAVDTGVVNLDTLLKGSASESVNVNALIQAQNILETVALDANIAAREDATVSLDALIKALGLLKSAALDVFISGVGAEAVDLDTLIQALGIPKTVALDALVKSIATEAVDLDALVAAVDSESVDLDALVKALGLSKTAAIDALIRTTDTKTVDLDTFLAVLNIPVTVNLDVIIYGGGELTIDLDALVAGREVKAISLDTFLEGLGLETVDLDTLIAAVESDTVDLDTLLKGFTGESVDLDTLLKGLGVTTAADLDALLRGSGSITVDLDTLLKAVGISTAVDLDTYIAARESEVVDLDARVAGRVSEVADLDVLLKGLGISTSVNLSAILGTGGLASVSMDTLLKVLGIQKTAAIDTLIQAANVTTTVALDALVQAMATEAIDLDALLKGVGSTAIDLDALVKALGIDITVALDALVQASDVEAIDLDVLIQALGLSTTVDLDAFISAVGSEAIDIDAFIVALGIDKTVAIDVLVRDLGLLTADLDVIIGGGGEVEISLDALIQALGLDKTIALDTLFHGLAIEVINLDVLLKALGASSTVNLDAFISAIESKAVDMDARIAGRDVLTVDLDTLIQSIGVSTSVNLTAVLGTGGVIEIGLQALLKALGVETTVAIDALVQSAGVTATVALDALIRSAGTKTASVDVLVQAQEILETANLDALIQALGITETADIDALIQGIADHSLDLDALLSGPVSEAIDIDAFIMAIGLSTTAALDALLSIVDSEAVSLDGLIKEIGIPESVALDSLLKGVVLTSVDIDALIQALGMSATVDLDSFLAAQGLDTVTLDALFRSAVLTTIQIDAILDTSEGRFMIVEIFTDQALDMSVETDQALEMECETW